MNPGAAQPKDADTGIRKNVTVRKMEDRDLVDARLIFRTAFGSFLGAPDPATFNADREYIFTRWRANPGAALVAEHEGGVAGSNFATKWGSFGFFGPLTVRPELWGCGIAQQLLVRTMDLFEQWGVRESGLFTFAHSPKHVALYRKFGYWPRFLTALLAKEAAARNVSWTEYSTLNESERAEAVGACRELTDSIFAGLDPTPEIQAIQDQNLGDTVLLWAGDRLDAFAVCHCGEGTEAGRDNCYIKFAAVRPGAEAGRIFERLLEACESFALKRGVRRVEAGVNTARSDAWSRMLQSGFQTRTLGVAMHRHNLPAFSRASDYILDDWR